MNAFKHGVNVASMILYLGGANSAELAVNGVKLNSHVETTEVRCDGYNVLIRTDKFPDEAEDLLEQYKGSAIPGFHGKPTIVGVRAFVSRAHTEQAIPDVAKKYQRSRQLINDGRVYLPITAYCLDKSNFVLSLWSGGNCSDCDMFIRYRIDARGAVVASRLVTEVDWKKIDLKKILPP